MEEYLKEIKKLAKEIGREVKLMEVCGTHTQVIAEYGIKKSLPSNIKLFSGPGCPVCITSEKDIDNVIKLALKGIPIATYGDMLRVKGSKMSLADARSEGARIIEAYSIEDVFKLDKKTVFFGIGFETTAPMSASAVKRGINLYSGHKAFIPAMKALLSSGEIKVDGLISPGHVASIVGSEVFKDLKKYDGRKIPQVITGFDLKDVLKGIAMLLKQIAENRAEAENEYTRVVKPCGNIKALELLKKVFDIKDSDWRGLGRIAGSGFELKKEFDELNAKVLYSDVLTSPSPSLRQAQGRLLLRRGTCGHSDSSNIQCLCAEVIKGNIESQKCPMFRKECNPENPQGPCMVSREGSCYIACKALK